MLSLRGLGYLGSSSTKISAPDGARRCGRERNGGQSAKTRDRVAVGNVVGGDPG